VTRGFAALLLAQACFGYAFSSFLLLPKFLVTELAAGPAEIGRVMAIYGITIVVFMPLVGGLVDRLGRRDFLTAGAAIMAATAFGFTAVGEIGPLLYALRALQGLAFALAFVGGATLAVDQAPPERLGQAIGLFGLTFLAMNAVAPAVVEEVAGSRGWSAAFAAAGGAAIVSSALSRLLRERRTPPHSSEAVPGVWEFARRPRQLRTSTVIALAGAALGAVFTFHQPFAIELGMTDVKSFFVAYATAAVSLRVALGSVVDRAGRRLVALLCLAAYVLVVSGMSQLRPGWLAVFGALMGTAHGLFYPAYNALAAEGVGAHERGKMMALFQAAWNSGFALGQLGLGALAERRGYPAVFVAGGLCSLAALIVLALSPEGRRSKEADWKVGRRAASRRRAKAGARARAISEREARRS
jgi:MFS family permease